MCSPRPAGRRSGTSAHRCPCATVCVSPCASEERFILGLSGYPWVSACVRTPCSMWMLCGAHRRRATRVKRLGGGVGGVEGGRRGDGDAPGHQLPARHDVELSLRRCSLEQRALPARAAAASASARRASGVQTAKGWVLAAGAPCTHPPARHAVHRHPTRPPRTPALAAEPLPHGAQPRCGGM